MQKFLLCVNVCSFHKICYHIRPQEIDKKLSRLKQIRNNLSRIKCLQLIMWCYDYKSSMWKKRNMQQIIPSSVQKARRERNICCTCFSFSVSIVAVEKTKGRFQPSFVFWCFCTPYKKHRLFIFKLFYFISAHNLCWCHQCRIRPSRNLLTITLSKKLIFYFVFFIFFSSIHHIHGLAQNCSNSICNVLG